VLEISPGMNPDFLIGVNFLYIYIIYRKNVAEFQKYFHKLHLTPIIHTVSNAWQFISYWFWREPQSS